MTPSDLASTWRTRAEQLRRWGADDGVARAWEAAAAELEAVEVEAADTELTLSEAAIESGYSERRLRELLADGTVPNAGRKGRPRIRRVDLPRRAPKSNGGGYDAQADAAALLGRLRAV